MASTIGFGILRSYPGLMQDQSTFPPFIHSRCYGSGDDGWNLPKSLRTAVFIATSFPSGSEEAVLQIRQEQHRIDNGMLEMDLQDLLSSLQSLIIYMIMRVNHSPQANDDDAHLSATVTRICSRIPSLPDFEAHMAGFSDWKRWIIIESKRRVNSVLRLMWKLYNLDVGIPCPSRNAYTAMPLPASKALWRASTEEEWESAIQADDFYSRFSHRDLLEFKGCTDGDQPSREEWARWYAGTDELGIVVAISASLL